MEIKKSHILITGANRGIGKSVAEICAESGAHLILANRSENPALVKNLQKLGAASVVERHLDLASRSQIEKFIEDMRDEKVDILFNNAGQSVGGLVENQKMKDVYEMIQVNFTGLVHLTHGILPGMLKRKKGKIINNASISAFMKFPASSTYSATKAAVTAFHDALKMELRGTKLSTLLLITPGIDTDMYRDIPKKQGPHFVGDLAKGMNPRVYATKIQEAIHEDFEVLQPTGLSGALLWLAKHVQPVSERIVMSGFKR